MRSGFGNSDILFTRKLPVCRGNCAHSDLISAHMAGPQIYVSCSSRSMPLEIMGMMESTTVTPAIQLFRLHSGQTFTRNYLHSRVKAADLLRRPLMIEQKDRHAPAYTYISAPYRVDGKCQGGTTGALIWTFDEAR